jgi:hypothetical protein
MNKKWLCLAVVATLLAGCATHRINWGARIGTYTLDQAIVEFGPPDKQAKLSDGRRVAEWISHYSDPGVVTFGTGFWGYPGSGGFVQSTGPAFYEDKLVLTFTTNNVLAAWSKR